MIFVTGATGFLGSYLAKNLINQGFKVRAFKRPASNFDLLGEYAQRIEWVAGDLLDLPSVESALQGIEKIYHCAGIVAPRMSERRKAVLINTEGSANLYNAALVSGVKKALHVSSTMALGRPVNAGVISENHNSGDGKKQPVYIESKRLGELEAWRTDAEGLPVVIVNPAGIIGAGKWQHE
ncbi:MAG TPA: NAD-dependent epimerase/dehydratase family protein, partial [Chitinophagales bacterium]|nr:NAD-dependent epimerase/dehydratase family protein [Chitinophagales bacterium]